MPITCLGSAVFLDRGLELGRLVGGEIMSNNRVVANLCRLLIILCVSGCAVTHRMSAKKERSLAGPQMAVPQTRDYSPRITGT